MGEQALDAPLGFAVRHPRNRVKPSRQNNLASQAVHRHKGPQQNKPNRTVHFDAAPNLGEGFRSQGFWTCPDALPLAALKRVSPFRGLVVGPSLHIEAAGLFLETHGWIGLRLGQDGLQGIPVVQQVASRARARGCLFWLALPFCAVGLPLFQEAFQIGDDLAQSCAQGIQFRGAEVLFELGAIFCGAAEDFFNL